MPELELDDELEITPEELGESVIFQAKKTI
jgi:hypothetical protein